MRYHNFTNVITLKDNQIFVFGSNQGGIHGAGAAYTARKYFNAKLGIGEGLTGQSYAIPTKDKELVTLDIERIKHSVLMFILYAIRHPNTEFIVTAIGCGLAGFKSEEIAPLFKGSVENIILPEVWKDIINKE